MAGSRTFGRKGLTHAAPPSARRAPAVREEAPNPQLDAFRASLKAGPSADAAGEDQAFEAWLRARRARRWLLIGVRLAFLMPGLFCFLGNAPVWVSLAMEGAGLFANAWIKTERVRQAREIATWTPDA
ncbi:MAG TPA: hypothetical protein VMU59_04990 [Caulobacteraceae bacterium]|nr:hypothetical protein [Caulobacteraceae bacterium]